MSAVSLLLAVALAGLTHAAAPAPEPSYAPHILNPGLPPMELEDNRYTVTGVLSRLKTPYGAAEKCWPTKLLPDGQADVACITEVREVVFDIRPFARTEFYCEQNISLTWTARSLSAYQAEMPVQPADSPLSAFVLHTIVKAGYNAAVERPESPDAVLGVSCRGRETPNKGLVPTCLLGGMALVEVTVRNGSVGGYSERILTSQRDFENSMPSWDGKDGADWGIHNPRENKMYYFNRDFDTGFETWPVTGNNCYLRLGEVYKADVTQIRHNPEPGESPSDLIFSFHEQ